MKNIDFLRNIVFSFCTQCSGKVKISSIKLYLKIFLVTDSKGNPRCITNSKGKKRRVGSKDLQQAIKTSDANFLDFIRRCLE